MRIAEAIYYEDTQEFKKAVDAFKDVEEFSASLDITREFAVSCAEEYVEYLKIIYSERPALLTVYREGYGQPIFRQIFQNGCEKSLDYYLSLPFCGKEILDRLLIDAKELHESDLDRLQEIREISFSLNMIPFFNENFEMEDDVADFIQEDPRYTILQLNNIVRQRRMIKVMQEKLNESL